MFVWSLFILLSWFEGEKLLHAILSFQSACRKALVSAILSSLNHVLMTWSLDLFSLQFANKMRKKVLNSDFCIFTHLDNVWQTWKNISKDLLAHGQKMFVLHDQLTSKYIHIIHLTNFLVQKILVSISPSPTGIVQNPVEALPDMVSIN